MRCGPLKVLPAATSAAIRKGRRISPECGSTGLTTARGRHAAVVIVCKRNIGKKKKHIQRGKCCQPEVVPEKSLPEIIAKQPVDEEKEEETVEGGSS